MNRQNLIAFTVSLVTLGTIASVISDTELFQQVKSGVLTIPQAERQVKEQRRERQADGERVKTAHASGTVAPDYLRRRSCGCAGLLRPRLKAPR